MHVDNDPFHRGVLLRQGAEGRWRLGSCGRKRPVHAIKVLAEMGTLFDFRHGGRGLPTLYCQLIPFRITRKSTKIDQLLCKKARFGPDARRGRVPRAPNLPLPCSGMTS
ncbi:hypothetical protein, partial [Ralstonia solanacearum]|uniref:hypothetical protein n=1 Tax=Ralstonia solanacearum TaxID=305 RepID=UPI001E29D45C